MIAYMLDRDGNLVGEQPAKQGDKPGSWVFPSNSTLIPPPSVVQNDKQAHWNGLQWEIIDKPTAEAQRKAVYEAEADRLREQAQIYRDKEEGFRLLEDLANATIAEEMKRQYLREYAAKTLEIRARFPDHPFYLLNSTGTYHAEGCAYANESAERLTLDQIATRDNVKPCTRCNAPALTELENE